MMRFSFSASLLSIVFVCLPLQIATSVMANETIDFSLQIRPILSEYCFHCHGPDESHREAGLRLDDLASSTGRLESGSVAVVPNKLAESELWTRIVSNDPGSVMPPPSTHKQLKPAQKELIQRWIESGAGWGQHWSYEPPTKKVVPESGSLEKNNLMENWYRNDIDRLVGAKMKPLGLVPAPDADPITLSRRIYLDVIGVPPSPQEVRHFVVAYQNDSDAAIEKLVESLLLRPEFGEHWARMWLDLARYADTKGYEKDLGRDMWPYRDWVIAALQNDMPYDRFTVEQLAGDLLPNTTESQRIATAFHRATLSNDEGGTDDEEFRVAAVKDRVDTTIQVWMGLTMGCAKCHSHKYDPISIEDYYRFYAIFNQTEDADRYDDEPRLSLPTFEQQSELIARERNRSSLAEEERMARDENLEIENARWSLCEVKESRSEHGSILRVLPDKSVLATGPRPEKDTYYLTAIVPPGSYRTLRFEALLAPLDETKPDSPQSVGRNPADPNFVLSELSLQVTSSDSKDARPVQMKSGRASHEQGGWPIINAWDGKAETGWAIGGKKTEAHWAVIELSERLELSEHSLLQFSLSQQFGSGLLLQRVRFSLSNLALDEGIPRDSPRLENAKKTLAKWDSETQQLRERIPKLPIMKELPDDRRRVTKIHQRGNFLDQTTVVEPALLAHFNRDPLSTARPPNRLDAARWLVSRDNPLTPRVAANRIWAQFFGRGIVETEEDFGSQGALPSHPELLDYLAIQYRDSFQWSTKKLIRHIVSSRTYRQSFVRDELRQRIDPRNVYLSSAPRNRLTAEAIRDNALAVSGLLSLKAGGPPVMPPQPDGLWRSTYSGAKWVTSTGADRYRRGIYTFWKRTTPYPSMETFDSSTREVCQVRRITTNTPLQSLITLNDPVYVEAALALAYRSLSQTNETRQAISFAFEHALGRLPTERELDRLLGLYEKSRTHFEPDQAAAKLLLNYAHFDRAKKVDDTTWAAMSVVTTSILNLDEVLTK